MLLNPNIFFPIWIIIVPIYSMWETSRNKLKKYFVTNQKLFWPFTVRLNCSSDFKNFANSCPSASNFKSFSPLLEQFFLTVGQNNFGNKIPIVNVFHNWTNVCQTSEDTGFYTIKLDTLKSKPLWNHILFYFDILGTQMLNKLGTSLFAT